MAGYAPTGGAGDLQAEAACCNGKEYFRLMRHCVGGRSVSPLSYSLASGAESVLRTVGGCAGCEGGGVRNQVYLLPE